MVSEGDCASTWLTWMPRKGKPCSKSVARYVDQHKACRLEGGVGEMEGGGGKERRRRGGGGDGTKEGRIGEGREEGGRVGRKEGS